jgi:hypothetical protein
MDVVKIQFKPGSVVKDLETGELLQVDYFSNNRVYFIRLKNDERSDVSWDYTGFLGSRYIKDPTYKVLYHDT